MVDIVDIFKLYQQFGPLLGPVAVFLIGAGQFSAYRQRYELEQRDRRVEKKVNRLITALSTSGIKRGKLTGDAIKEFDLLEDVV